MKVQGIPAIPSPSPIQSGAVKSISGRSPLHIPEGWI
jgi:hypothetical protein